MVSMTLPSLVRWADYFASKFILQLARSARSCDSQLLTAFRGFSLI